MLGDQQAIKQTTPSSVKLVASIALGSLVILGGQTLVEKCHSAVAIGDDSFKSEFPEDSFQQYLAFVAKY